MHDYRQSVSLRSVQLYEVEILREFTQFCDERQLRYYLAGGTLLGAIRHRGFIPWDDDIDIWMPRPDFETMRKIVKDFENTSEFEIRGFHNIATQYSPYLKVVNANILTQSSSETDFQPIWVDVFPIDLISKNPIAQALTLGISQFLMKALALSASVPSRRGRPARQVLRTLLKATIARPSLSNTLAKLLNSACKNALASNPGAIGNIAWGNYGKRELFPVDAFEDTVLLDFEGYKFRAPFSWKLILSQLYGNYLDIPPADRRRSHLIAAWIKDSSEN